MYPIQLKLDIIFLLLLWFGFGLWLQGRRMNKTIAGLEVLKNISEDTAKNQQQKFNL